MNSILNKKNILITGGSGSIGQALAKKALTDGANLIKIFSNDENSLYETEQEFGKNDKFEYIIGDIRDDSKVKSIIKNIDIVFHAAALKHVDRCEFHPFEAFQTNIVGTNNVIQAAIHEGVKKLIYISTDKAVNPIGVMGASKLLGEKLISAEAFYNSTDTIFASTRFGNVLHSRGSVLPLIEKQIRIGGPITLTDKRMKRFFMTKEDAVNLITKATELSKGGETFVLKMPLLMLNDLFDSMKQILSSKYGYDPSSIKTKIIGLKPGEKIFENLLTDHEMETVLETKDFFIIPPLQYVPTNRSYPGVKKLNNPNSYFSNLKPLEKPKIIKLLKKLYRESI